MVLMIQSLDLPDAQLNALYNSFFKAAVAKYGRKVK